MDIKLQKLGFKTAFANVRDFYRVMDSNRERLAPWFWWMSRDVTPNLQKTLAFMTLYILDTKRKMLVHKIDKTKLYDEQFFIMVNNRIGGMVGLDNISTRDKNAEIWYLVTAENESQGIASQAVQFLEDYSIATKSVSSLYAKIAAGNIKSTNLIKRNGYEIQKVEHGVPVSKRNPKITDLTTWIKYFGSQRQR